MFKLKSIFLLFNIFILNNFFSNKKLFLDPNIFNLPPFFNKNKKKELREDFRFVFGLNKEIFYSLNKDEIENHLNERIRYLKLKKKEFFFIKKEKIFSVISYLENALNFLKNQKKITDFLKTKKTKSENEIKKKSNLNFKSKKIQRKITDFFRNKK